MPVLTRQRVRTRPVKYGHMLYVVLTQLESYFATIRKKKPQAIRTLASTLKIPIFVFFSCSSAESYTEKKGPTGGWDRPTMCSVHRAMQMHVDVLEMYI